MTSGVSAIVRCQLRGEFIDDAETDVVEFLTQAPLGGKVPRTTIFPEFLDVAPSESLQIQTFVVVLRNNERIAVRGHGVKFVPNNSNPSDEGSYGVVLYDGDKELFVALVKKMETIGIFANGSSKPEAIELANKT
jgi:hypothetical protein